MFYGYMDTTGWMNMHNPQLNLSFSPTPKLKVMLDYHLYWNADTNDAWHRVNGVTAVRPLNAAANNAGSFRGQEIDLTAIYKLNPHVGLQAGYSYFIAGDYLEGHRRAQQRALRLRPGADRFLIPFILKPL